MTNERAIVWFAGLDTPIGPLSDLGGIRPLLEKLAKLTSSDLIVASWNGEGMSYPVAQTLARVNAGNGGGKYKFIALGGHSHGADELYKQLEEAGNQALYDVAVFDDLCPFGNPTAWMGGPWPAPTNVDNNLCFFQRNDVPLAGVRMIGGGATGKAVQLIDATAWGLHHAGANGMQRDPRVQNRIELAVLDSLNAHLRIDAGFGAGGQTVPQFSPRTENA